MNTIHSSGSLHSSRILEGLENAVMNDRDTQEHGNSFQQAAIG